MTIEIDTKKIKRNKTIQTEESKKNTQTQTYKNKTIKTVIRKNPIEKENNLNKKSHSQFSNFQKVNTTETITPNIASSPKSKTIQINGNIDKIRMKKIKDPVSRM